MSWEKEQCKGKIDEHTTLEAVPPGQQPSNIKPTEREGESPKVLLITNAEAGIIVYWATQPNNIWTKSKRQETQELENHAQEQKSS